MSTDLFFSQPTPRNSINGIQSDKIESDGVERSSKFQPTHEMSQAGGANFLTTLKQVSQGQAPCEHFHHVAGVQSSKNTASAKDSKIDETSDYAAPQVNGALPTEGDETPDQMATDSNLATLFKMLEKTGLHDIAGGSDLQTNSDVNPVDSNLLDAIDSAIAGLEQNQFEPTADRRAGFESMLRFIVNALESKFSMLIDGASNAGLSQNQVVDLAQMMRWLKGLTTSIQHQSKNSALLMGDGAAGVKASETAPVGDTVGIQWADRSVAMRGNCGATAVFQSAENSAARFQSEIRGQADPSLATHARLDANDHQNPKPINAIGIADVETSKTREERGFWRDLRNSNHPEAFRRIASAPDQDQQAGNENARTSQPLKPNISSVLSPAAVRVLENPAQSNSSQGLLSKVLQEIQLVKEGVMKVESGTADETISKVIKTETGAHGPGLLNSSGQSADKAADIKFFAKETESVPSRLRNLTMDQIVRQTAIHLRNGQNEARIDLKPDFLGHIRMQVISKNQQVTVKILAEYGFVKDMIESNFHQLKIELRQQGLEVDRLEVMVSGDPEDSGDLKEKHTRSKAKPSTVDTRNEDLPPADQQSGSRQPLENAYHNRSVDYFA